MLKFIESIHPVECSRREPRKFSDMSSYSLEAINSSDEMYATQYNFIVSFGATYSLSNTQARNHKEHIARSVRELVTQELYGEIREDLLKLSHKAYETGEFKLAEEVRNLYNKIFN